MVECDFRHNQFCSVVAFSELNEETVVLVQIVAQNKVKGVLLR